MGAMDFLKRKYFERKAEDFNREASRGEVTRVGLDNDPNWRERIKNQIQAEKKIEPLSSENKG